MAGSSAWRRLGGLRPQEEHHVGAAARSPSEVPPRHQPHRQSRGALGALLAAASRHGGCHWCSRGAALSRQCRCGCDVTWRRPGTTASRVPATPAPRARCARAWRLFR